MKLLLVTSRFPFGAKELFLREEIDELSRHHDTRIAAAVPLDDPICEPQFEPITLERLKVFSPQTLRLALRAFFRAPLDAFSVAFDVIAQPRSIAAKLKNAAIFPKALAVAEQARAQGVDHVHAYWLSGPATIAYVVSRLAGIPWSATGHRYDLVDYNIRSVGTPYGGFVKTASFVRAISSRGRDQISLALNAGARKNDVVLEHLGVRVFPSVSSKQDDGVFRLLCTAGLERIKGHDVLLDALANAVVRGARVHCTLAGIGSLREQLEARAAELGISDSVTFRGFVPHSLLIDELTHGTYDAAILTSRDEGPGFCEGIPVSLVEAMAAGLPVIATRSGAVSELIDDSCGILCEPEDSDAIAIAIARVAADPVLRSTLAKGGRERVASDYDIVETCSRMARRIFPEPEDGLGPTALSVAGAGARQNLRRATLCNATPDHYNRDDAGIP